MQRFILFVAILFRIATISFCQDHRKIDSLEDALEKDISDTARIDALNDLSILNLKIDIEKSKKYSSSALLLAKEKKHIIRQAKSYSNLANINSTIGKVEISIQYYDSALRIYTVENDLKGLASALNDKGMLFESTANYDSALLFYEKALEINLKTQNKEELANNYSNIGMIHYSWTDYTKAIEYYEKAMAIDKEIGNLYGVAVGYNNSGLAYVSLNENQKAIELFHEAIETAKEAKKGNATGPFYNNIGLVNYKLGNYLEAIEYFKYCLDINGKIDAKYEMVTNLQNIAAVYSKIEKFDLALTFFDSALIMSQETKSRDQEASIYKGYYKIFKKKKDFSKALDYYIKHATLKDSIFSDESQKRIAEYETKYQSEIKEQQIEILNKENLLKKETMNKQKLIIYFATGCLIAVLIFTFVLIKQIKLKNQKNIELNLINEELIQKNEEIYQQKEEILAQSEQLEESNRQLEKLSLAASKTDNAVMIMDGIGAILWTNDAFKRMYGYTLEEYKNKRGNTLKETSFNPNIEEELQRCLQTKQSIFYLTNYTTKDGDKRWAQTTLTPIVSIDGKVDKLISIDSDITQIKEQEQRLTSLNEALNQKNEEITQQRNSLEELNTKLKEQKEKVLAQKEEILTQHKIIQEKNTSVTASIQYATRIQKATLPPKEYINSLFPDHFILYKAKDIISGDFYWFQDEIIEDTRYKFFAAVDCTGHGVPGAFMSLLGYNLLNQAVKQEKIYNPSAILEFLSTNFYNALHKTGEDIDVKTGMDISLCSYNTHTQELQYSGASNSLYVLDECTLTELKGDRIPIGVKLNNMDEKYKTHSVNIKKGNMVYLFSDGYKDQFGGSFGKKFMGKKFKNLLTDICNLPIEEQYKTLNYNFIKWKGSYEQIDDVLVIGISF